MQTLLRQCYITKQEVSPPEILHRNSQWRSWLSSVSLELLLLCSQNDSGACLRIKCCTGVLLHYFYLSGRHCNCYQGAGFREEEECKTEVWQTVQEKTAKTMRVKGNRPGSWKSGQEEKRADRATRFKAYLTGACRSLRKPGWWKQICRWNTPGGTFGIWGAEPDCWRYSSKQPLCNVGVTDELTGLLCPLLKKSPEFIKVKYRFALLTYKFWLEMPGSTKRPEFV